jgi:drug/metabolite transporter (DMT)-like permease
VIKNHRGELYLFLGALTFSVNGIFSTVVLEHMSAFRLAQIRAISAFTILFLFALIFRRELLRITRRELPLALAYGIIGFALVNVGYFLGIERGLPLGLVLVLEFTAPIWIALWIKYVRKGYVAKDMWVAIALSLIGLLLVTKIWDGFKFDLLGLVGALGSAFALTGYFLIGEKFGAGRHPMSSTIIGLGIAGAFWAIVLPIWNFPTAIFTAKMDIHGYLAGHLFPGWLLLLWIVVMGTIVPYLFVISGLRLLSASKSSVIGMLEPVLAGIFAWIWLNQSWDSIQLVGAAIVLIGIYLADRSKAVATSN